MRPITYLERGALTQWLLDRLTDDGLLVGDAAAPKNGGWSDDPNKPSSVFFPYLVVIPQQTSEGTGSLGDSNSEYRSMYSSTVYAPSREMTEFYADKARKSFVDLARTVVVLGDFSWKVQQVRSNTIGAIGRTDMVEPSEYTQTDTFTLYLSKEMT